MTYLPASDRYEQMKYARCGRSGLDLPKIALGMWHNFGGSVSFETARTMVLRSFDRGVTYFDLANNYGTPYGSAEETFGRVMTHDLGVYRDEIIISTKAGYDMWPGPYGQGGGSRKYILASLDQSLRRMSVDYVDIFYSHRDDPTTPLEETMSALATAVQQGKALYVGISSYDASRTVEAVALLHSLGTPCLVHQPSYSIVDRWIEDEGVLDVLDETGLGCVVFSPLSQGILTGRYLSGIPESSRAAHGDALTPEFRTDTYLNAMQALERVARRRGQTLAQMAISWVLRDPRVTSAIVGASNWSQLNDNLGALDNLEFADAELIEIDEITDSGRIGHGLL
ncbi:MAG: L-glyceraldehyde 3-phosphate reductase [Acidimicrobiia bacterium]